MTRTAWHIVAGATLALAVSLLALMSASDSQAIITFAVNSDLDEPDLTPADDVCLSTPGGFCTLRAAIMQTNELPGKDIVDVPAGLYELTIAGTGEDNSATGDLDILDDVIIDGASGIAEIDANDIDRVFDVDPNADDLNVEMYDLLITNGLTPGLETGGGIDTSGDNTVLHVERAFFEGNSSAIAGGGLYNRVALTLIDAEFSANLAPNGGGIYINTLDNFPMTNVAFYNNGASSSGAGIFLADGATTVTNAHFYENIAGVNGGAVLAQDTFSLDLGTFTENMATAGGAVYSDFGGLVDLSNVTMENNEADFGGAIYNADEVDVSASVLYSNFANVNGGGILNAGFATIDLRNVTISSNEAIADGGGIANYGDLVNMNNVTITLNTADFDNVGAGEGGGVFNNTPVGVDVVISNTIIGNNNLPSTSPDCEGFITSAAYNLIENLAGCTITGDTTGNITGQDPQLVFLQDNGGPTRTHALVGSSPALDSANPATPGTLLRSCETVDQRGISRPRDGNADANALCDMGAFELIGAGPTATPFGSPSPSPTASPTSSPSPPPGTATPTSSPTSSATPTSTPLQLTWANANCLAGIDPIDSLAVLRADAGLQVTQGANCVPLGDSGEFDGTNRIWGDFDCSGGMSPVDSLKILQFDSGFQPIQPANCPDFGDMVTLT
ncbi:MAG: choice-of-anchor Q domain-containing protein [Dehalococcoidia bacterium]